MEGWEIKLCLHLSPRGETKQWFENVESYGVQRKQDVWQATGVYHFTRWFFKISTRIVTCGYTYSGSQIGFLKFLIKEYCIEDYMETNSHRVYLATHVLEAWIHELPPTDFLFTMVFRLALWLSLTHENYTFLFEVD